MEKYLMFACEIRTLSRVLKLMTALAVVLIASVGMASASSHIANVVGPNACAECHKTETANWKTSLHFNTFREMPRRKETKIIAKKMGIKRVKADSLCLDCHFTSQIVKGKPKPVSGISCESCHGPGKNWIKIHSKYMGGKIKEPKGQDVIRWKNSEEAGMIRPVNLYNLAKNCYACHVVPKEKLVNVGGHPAGSAFDLVAWSQGEVRHNTWYSKDNTPASANRKRILYVVGLAVELETALRAVGKATQKKKYAVSMARRASAARKKLIKVAKALPKAKELVAIIKASKSAKLKLNNDAALSAAADKVGLATLSVVGKYDGSSFAAVDSMMPRPDKYIGKPSQ
jgi:Cytochrome c554 and c-prime